MIRRWLAAHSLDVLIGIVALCSVLVYVIAAERLYDVGFPLDDSWIHQTYARNLAHDGQWAFVPGESSMASTSPLYTVLLSAGYVFDIPFFAWTFGLGVLALAGVGWIGARLSTILFPDMARVGLWTGLALVLLWHLQWAAASGMETMLFCTLSLTVFGLVWRELYVKQEDSRADTLRRGLVVGLAGAALTLTRPEGAGLVGLAGLMVLIAWPYGERFGNNWQQYAAWGGGVALGWVIGVAPYVLMNYHVNDTLLPSTSSAKQAENAPLRELPLLERYGRLVLPLVAGGQLVLLPGLVAALRKLIRSRQRQHVLLLLPFVWAIAHLSLYALRLPAHYQHGRYVIPILPPVVLYGVGGTLTIVQTARRRPVQRVLSRSLALSALLIIPAFTVIGAQAYARDVRIINTEMVDTAHWINDNLPPDDLLAVHDIGALGYYAPRPILDLAGLVSPEVVPIILDHEALMVLMCERDVRYLMVLPDQLPALPDDPRLGPAPLFITNAPYSPDAGGGNMAVYRMNWPDVCQSQADD
ncbi:MAG: hypothetical protein JW966_00355 [Anaerolineae bacterium]|nr:hypothetical protein [Anaerolineae bacterium]